MIKLFKHQIEGRDALLKYKKYCLFFQVGQGKTFTALDALIHLVPGSKVLIVAPKKVIKGVWESQTEYDLSDYDVTYINYEKIARDPEFHKRKFDCVILDEVHKLKGKTTKISKIMRKVNYNATYVWGLTGTPIANNYMDVYCIFKNMDIKEFEMDYTSFMTTYYYTHSLGHGRLSHVLIPTALKPAMKDSLLARINNHSMTVTRNDGDIDNEYEVISVDRMATDSYYQIEAGIIDNEKESRTMISLEAVNKARQAANGFIYDRDGGVTTIGHNYKLDALDELLEYVVTSNGEKVIVVYMYEYDLQQIMSLPYKITTDFEKFSSNQILALNISQCEGLNLQKLSHSMIFYSYDYSFLHFEQMCGRIDRTGQTEQCKFYIMVSKGTIEEKVYKAVKTKQSTAEFFMEVSSKWQTN